MSSTTPIADDTVHKALALAGAHITEIQVNQGWQPNSLYPNFTADMKSVGWYVSGEWCAFSGILVLKWAYAAYPKIWNYFYKLLSGNSQQTVRNCHNDKFWPTGLIPRPGCIVVWQEGDSSTEGHLGLCVSTNGNQFVTAEGNTSSPGDTAHERLGWTYTCHTHYLNQPHTSLGLNLLRCVYVVEEADFEKFGGH